MAQRELSQSELARRIGVTQATIHRLVSGGAYGTTHLHRIARELGTTADYLTGEIDDPSEGAAPPAPKPNVQLVTMQVALPSEDALTRMFLGVLEASSGMEQAELARELAKTLPTGLQLLRGPLIYDDQDVDADPREFPAAQPSADRERRRA